MEDLINSVGAPLIAFVVPLVVGLIKKLKDDMPTWLIPILAAVIGPVGAFALDALGAIQAEGWVLALLGVAGIGIRELFDQLGKVFKGEEAPAE